MLRLGLDSLVRWDRWSGREEALEKLEHKATRDGLGGLCDVCGFNVIGWFMRVVFDGLGLWNVMGRREWRRYSLTVWYMGDTVGLFIHVLIFVRLLMLFKPYQ